MWNDQILGILPSILLADTIQVQNINYYSSNENKQIHVKLHKFAFTPKSKSANTISNQTAVLNRMKAGKAKDSLTPSRPAVFRRSK